MERRQVKIWREKQMKKRGRKGDGVKEKRY